MMRAASNSHASSPPINAPSPPINAPSPPADDPLAFVSNSAVAQDALLNMVSPEFFLKDTTTDTAADDQHAGGQGEKYAADDDEHAGGQGEQYIAQKQLLIALRDTLLQQQLERNKRTNHEYSCEKLEENEDANKTENGNKKQRKD